MERAKKGWHISPNDKIKVKAEVKIEDPIVRKPTKLEETRDAFIALARKCFMPPAPSFDLTGAI
jgi:hypothetical protein